jgi:thiol-disulfide isomerase/thioredoxin
MKKNKFLLAISLIALSFTLQAQQVPPPLIGNWIETQSNRWEYGFYEHFAIYDCAFWDYSAVQQKGKITKITLQKDGRTLTIEVEQKNDSLVTVKNGKSKKQDYTLMHKRYPDYQTPDNTPFPVPAFWRDSATVIGYYRNFDKMPELLEGAPEEIKDKYRSTFCVSICDFFVDEPVKYQTGIDSLGRFSITVPLLNSQLSYINWPIFSKDILLSPNDTLFLFVDLPDLFPQEGDKSWEDVYFHDRQILCMGSNARINNELFQYRASRLFVNREEEVKKGISDREYLSICENVYNQRVEHLEKYITAHPAVSEKFRFLLTTEEKYRFASNLMQHRFDKWTENGNLPFQEGYMDYVNEKFLLYNPLTYTLVQDYESFIRDYIGYYSDNQPISLDLRLLLEEANMDTPENRQLVDEYEAEEAKESYTGRIYMDRNYHTVDSLLQEPVLKELWMAHLYYKDFEQRRIPWKEKDLQVMKSRIKNPYLLNMLLEINDKYAALGNKEIEYPESLKNTDYLANETDAGAILEKITAPYKGKVIFMDFWGTWCGPCIKNIKEKTPLLEEKFKGKDLIFMYLANNSPEPAWRNFIKQQQLTGEQIVHYRLSGQQQRLLEQKLNVRSFPTYFIIDRAGNIINYEVRYPMNVQETIEALEKTLNNEPE